MAKGLGENVLGLFGVVTGIDPELIPAGNASDMLDVDTVNGVAVPRNGYRNVYQPVTNQTTNKGFWFCQTYVSNTLYEALVSFDNISGTVKPYERSYNNATDSWDKTTITGPGGAALSLSDTYWRGLSFGTKAYFWNYNDSHPFNQYTLADYDSWVPVEPPANPTNAPTVVYYLNQASRAYAKYLGAQSGYAAGDVTTDGTVAGAVSITGQAVKVEIKANGHFTITLNLKHSGGNVDLTYNDVFNLKVTVAGDPANLGVLLKAIKAIFYNGSTTQEVSVSVVSETTDTAGNLKSVQLYLKFAGKGTRATWATTTQLILEGDVGSYSSTDYLLISPMEAGGMVDWGPNTTQHRIMYTGYNSTTTFESGPSLAKNMDRAAMAGVLLGGDPNFPMGTVPRVTITALADADYFRLYTQINDISTKKPGAWRRVVEQSDGTVTYDYATLYEDFNALNEYAPGGFDYQNILNGFVFKQWVVWLYRGAVNNVRATRYNNPVAQATTDEAFKDDLSQEDEERGANFTLNADYQDEPIQGVQMGNVAVVAGNKCIAVMVDTENLPKGMSPPRVVPGAPGMMGPHAFARWIDETGTPIFVYVAKGGDSIWAVRVPNGITVDSIEAITAYKFSNLIDGSLDVKLFGQSQNRSEEAIHVYVHGYDDSLHVRYNTREIVFKRPDAIGGKRPWQFYNYSTGQWGDQWNKFQAFQWSKGWDIMGIRLNGAMDEFERANMKDPATGGRIYEAIDASAKTPSSLSATVATFTDPPPWSSGTPVTVETTGNGLTVGTQYYVGRVSYVTYSFYTTQANAQAAGATGRVTLSSTGAWAAGEVTPNGPEDGAAFQTDPYWTSKQFFGPRRRVQDVFVNKKDLTDSVDVTVYSDRQTSDQTTVASGDRYARFGPRQSGDSHKFKFTLSERHSGVRGFGSSESQLSQRRQR